MGKKKKNENTQQPNTENQPIEGKFLLGKPKFKKLENGRYKCVQTGHELPADARESYAQTKHCRLGLIDAALARNKPPLNMFNQDPLCRSKLICKLTGHTVNKTEEHIWKHINGRRFLSMLEKEEAEAEAGKESSNGLMEEEEEEEGEQKPEKDSKTKEEGTKKNKKKKKKDKKKKEKEIEVSKVISEVRNPEEQDSDAEEEEFWMPPVGDRWDFDNGKDRWGSDSDSDADPENDDADETEAAGAGAGAGAGEEENNEAQELSKRTKRMSIEIEQSELASKKKKKTEST